MKNIQNYREYRLAHATVYLNEAPTGHSWPAEQAKRHGWALIDPWNSDNLDGDGGGWAGVCASVCVRICVRA